MYHKIFASFRNNHLLHGYIFEANIKEVPRMIGEQAMVLRRDYNFGINQNDFVHSIRTFGFVMNENIAEKGNEV